MKLNLCTHYDPAIPPLRATKKKPTETLKGVHCSTICVREKKRKKETTTTSISRGMTKWNIKYSYHKARMSRSKWTDVKNRMNQRAKWKIYVHKNSYNNTIFTWVQYMWYNTEYKNLLKYLDLCSWNTVATSHMRLFIFKLSKIALATFQVCSSRIWLLAAVLDCIDRYITFPQLQKVLLDNVGLKKYVPNS